MYDYTAPLDAETESHCSMCLFTNVENCDELKSRVIKGELSCAVIKAALVVDPFHVLVAANKAAINRKLNQLTTKTLYTEILFCLSTSKNISRSLEEFGINDKDKNILIVWIHKPDDQKSISEAVADCIKGKKVPISRLAEYTDIELVKKTYKIDKDELNVSSFTDSIVSRISCKDFASLK